MNFTPDFSLSLEDNFINMMLHLGLITTIDNTTLTFEYTKVHDLNIRNRDAFRVYTDTQVRIKQGRRVRYTNVAYNRFLPLYGSVLTDIHAEGDFDINALKQILSRYVLIDDLVIDEEVLLKARQSGILTLKAKEDSRFYFGESSIPFTEETLQLNLRGFFTNPSVPKTV